MFLHATSTLNLKLFTIELYNFNFIFCTLETTKNIKFDLFDPTKTTLKKYK